MADEYFRAGVAIVVLGPGGAILGLERNDMPGSWQVPQGGIGSGEDLREAAARELREETGIEPFDVIFVDEHPSWLTYELPPSSRTAKTGRGQAIRFFLLRMVSGDATINLTPERGEQEFTRYRWMSTNELLDACWDVKRPLYQQALDHWAEHVGDRAVGHGSSDAQNT